MKNIKSSPAAKVIAIFLFIVFTISTVLSVGSIVFLADNDAYFDDGKGARDAAIDIAANTYWMKLYKAIDNILVYEDNWYYDEFKMDFGKEANFYCEVKDEEGNVVLSNYKDVKYQRLYNRTYTTGYHYSEGIYYPDGQYYITAIIPEELEVRNGFYYGLELADWIISIRYALIVIAFVSFAFMVISFVFIMCSAGCRKEHEEAVPNFVDKMPLDIYLILSATVFVVSVILFGEVDICFNGMVVLIILPFMCILWLLMFVSVAMTFATRIKLGTLFKNTIIARILVLCLKVIKRFFTVLCQIPLFIKSVMLYVAVCCVEFIALLSGYGSPALFWLLEKCVLGFIFLVIMMNLRKLFVAGRKISGGDLDYKIDTDFMFFEFKEHAYNLNEIGGGLQNAVDKSIKSERMKAELITNVSHDIKTPLTSIINYVDLLKREGLASENAGEYLAVLDRQSLRLKKLTEDLIEASKASTGNVKVNAERLDVNILLSQAIGEYEEKFNDRNLFMVTGMAEEELFIWADGRLLWRVFDNMLNNIAKYAKQDTRVYISTSKLNGEINIVFKNISDAALNISSDELMERFVRGDSSRNTEGSGFGLSIANSLTELMGGRFEIIIDGDLFKCSMTFAEKL